MKQFQGRVICPGTCEAEALVSHGGFNTLASYQMALMFHDKQVKCGDQNNPDLYKKPMIGKALCLPETIGSTTGGMVLYTACASGQQPACMLFSKHIDSLAASGAILASVWTDADMPVIDCLGDEFLAAVQTGQTVRVLDAAPADVSLGEGQVLVKAKRVYLGLSDGAVELLEVKPDGKRAMAASAWAAGLQGADLTWGVLS